MRKSRWLLALAGLLPVVVPGCGTKVDGQLMLAVQTDMSLPKDIDQIRIEVLNARTGGVIFQNDYFKFGNDDNTAIRLPATLGIVASEDVHDPVKIRVIASHGLIAISGSEAKPKAKVLREVVTTVPKDRFATLPIAIEFLCDGSAVADMIDPSGHLIVKNKDCPGDSTCVAGTCKSSAVPEATLPTFVASEVFGGGTGTGDGTCFDVAKCFDGGTDVKLELDTCQAQVEASDNINVALRTQGAGICGKSGCFVALDADSESGWKRGSNGKIQLPTGVCDRINKTGDIVGVLTAPVGKETCQKKQISVPTCGPWSAVGGDDQALPDPKQPTVIASGQSNPHSLFVAGGKVYWTSGGTFGDNDVPNKDGAVKAVSIDGGQLTVIANGQAVPYGLAADLDNHLFLWTNANDGTIQWAPFLDDKALVNGKELLNGRLQPQGIATFFTESKLSVYWTEVANNKVFHVDASVDGSGALSANAQEVVELVLPSPLSVVAPLEITATKDGACWTYKGDPKSTDGVVACSFSKEIVSIAQGEHIPRTIATKSDGTGVTTGVYWANFAAASTGGGIFMRSLVNGVPQGTGSEKIAAEDSPAGLLIDGETLYWTSYTRGAVMRLRAGETMPTPIATGQQHPGALAVDNDAVYWINERVSDVVAPSGAIMRMAKN